MVDEGTGWLVGHLRARRRDLGRSSTCTSTTCTRPLPRPKRWGRPLPFRSSTTAVSSSPTSSIRWVTGSVSGGPRRADSCRRERHCPPDHTSFMVRARSWWRPSCRPWRVTVRWVPWRVRVHDVVVDLAVVEPAEAGRGCRCWWVRCRGPTSRCGGRRSSRWVGGSRGVRSRRLDREGTPVGRGWRAGTSRPTSRGRESAVSDAAQGGVAEQPFPHVSGNGAVPDEFGGAGGSAQQWPGCGGRRPGWSRCPSGMRGCPSGHREGAGHESGRDGPSACHRGSTPRAAVARAAASMTTFRWGCTPPRCGASPVFR